MSFKYPPQPDAPFLSSLKPPTTHGIWVIKHVNVTPDTRHPLRNSGFVAAGSVKGLFFWNIIQTQNQSFTTAGVNSPLHCVTNAGLRAPEFGEHRRESRWSRSLGLCDRNVRNGRRGRVPSQKRYELRRSAEKARDSTADLMVGWTSRAPARITDGVDTLPTVTPPRCQGVDVITSVLPIRNKNNGITRTTVR